MATKVSAASNRNPLTPWDPVEHLTSEEAIAGYLDVTMEEAGGDPALMAAVLGDIARARGILELAKKTGKTRT